MASKKDKKENKSVLNLALELGVRTETVLQAMRDMDLPADEWTTFNGDEESAIIEQMVINGAISSSLAKGKKRRKLTDEPIVNDDLFTEALGASESGFSDSNIPRQVLSKSGSAKKSLFQKWFGEKKDIVNSVKAHPFDEAGVETLFNPEEETEEYETVSPLQEIDQPTPMLPEPVEEVVPAEAEETVQEPEPAETELAEEDLEGMEDLEIDEDLLSSMQDIEIEDEGEEGFASLAAEEKVDEIAAEDLEDLGEITDEQLENVDLEEIESFEGGTEEEELDIELDRVELDELSLEGGEEGEEKKEGVHKRKAERSPAGFIEKIFSQINLSPLEMWTIMGGSVVIVLALLGLTVYWWLFLSPRALEASLAQAESAYNLAIESELEWQKGRAPWKKTKGYFENAIKLYAEYIEKHPNELQSIKSAHNNKCDSYYRIAIDSKKEGDKEGSQNAFRLMASSYEEFLDLYEKIARMNVGDSEKRHLSYPDVEDQRKALYRISVAKRELEQFEETIASLKDFVDRFRDTDQALESLIEIGNAYQEWAKSKKDQELSLLRNAIEWYNKALEKTAPDDDLHRMSLYAKIGDVQYRLYEQNKQSDKSDEANQYLREVIANYEKANEEADKKTKEIEENPPDPITLRSVKKEIQHVRKKLGDLYLLRGQESGKEWKDYEDTAEPFPDSIAQKQQLLEAAKREKETTKEFLTKADELYNELLTDRDLLDNDDFEDILYNKTQSFYIMREYPQALAAGDQLLNASRELSKEIRTKILYLLGNTAWEQAKSNGDYTKVKEYYYKALELDPLYPPEEKGDTSHLADIRLINAYYLNGENKDYPEAIKRFDNMANRYPESGYTYLTLFYYGKTLEEYGDVLSEQANKLREEAKNSSNSPILLAQARQMEDKARENYDLGVVQYNKAINSRPNSKYVDTQNEQFLKQIMFNRGHSAFKGGKYREAEGYYKDALAKYGDDNTAGEFKPLAIERLGDLNARLTSYDQAIDYYKQYMDNAYDNPDMRVTMKLADAYLKRYSWDTAREWYRKIVNNDPLVPTEAQIEKRLRMELPIQKGPGFEALKKSAESYLREALTYTVEDRQKKMEDALEAYKTFAQRYPLGASKEDREFPSDPDSLRTIAMIQYELGQYDEAAKSYEKFLAADPTFARKGQIQYRIGQSYMNVKNYDKAIEALSLITQESLDNSLQYADALILLGQAYQNKANEFLTQSRDDGLYTSYLQRAQRTYNRVSITKEPQKIKEANTMSAAIDTIIQSRAELAAGSTGGGK